MSASVREMTIADLRTVSNIDGQVHSQPWSLVLFKQELANDARRYVVAEIEGEVVGHGGVMFLVDEAHISTMAVDPAFQRRRIGTVILDALIHAAKGYGMTSMTLEVRAGNEPAIALYRKFGFAPAGIRPNYYSDTNEDALIMWAHDIDSSAYQLRIDGIRRELEAA
jgi:ribosomal-protein-alanine N-acetyltransferase